MIFFIAGIVLFSVLFFYFVWSAPYVPTWGERFQNVIELAQVKPGEKVVDLGSGDGRLVIAFAQAGAEAHGYEINPMLVFRSRKLIKKAKLEGRAFIHWGSFWNADLSPYRLVVIYGMSHIMGRLERKLLRELSSGSRVVSIYFKFSSWPSVENRGSINLYKK